MKLLAIGPVDRNIIFRDNFMFYFNKLLEAKRIEVQDDLKTKKSIKAWGMWIASGIVWNSWHGLFDV